MLRTVLNLDLGLGSGLHIDELLEGAALATRGCATRIGSLWWGGPPSAEIGGGACASAVVVDIAFLALLVIAVIAVVRIRQRGEDNRLELARRFIEQGMEPPTELFPSSAQGDLRRGIVLVFSGLGLLAASLSMPGLGPTGLIPGFVGLGYLVSYGCAIRKKKVP
jgi:hypothetical protein